MSWKRATTLSMALLLGACADESPSVLSAYGGAPSEPAASGGSGATASSAAGAPPVQAGGGGAGAGGSAGSAEAGAAVVAGAAGTTSGAGGSAGAISTPPPGELLWADGEWSFTGSRYAVTGAPSDWHSPVNYFDGSIQVRIVVRENPQHQPVWFELVIWKTVMESSAPHACLSCTKATDLANPGTYSCSVSPKGGAGWSCHGAEALDWTVPFGSVQASAKLSNDGNARVTPPSDLPGDYGFKVHYSAVLVESGRTFSGWDHYPVPEL